ncbi:MAG: hypothetical protein GYA02_04050, partial [Clostridiaceae bacterium]|nr:hypothetical protein [Clostridiaceae bacterium]
MYNEEFTGIYNLYRKSKEIKKQGDANYEAYRKYINHIVLFLEGKDDSILEFAKEKLIQASNKLEFEKAAKYRDDIRAIMHVLN